MLTGRNSPYFVVIPEPLTSDQPVGSRGKDFCALP